MVEHDQDAILARLDAGGWERFARAWVDHLLGRPLGDLLDPALVADLIVTTLEATVDNPTTERWIRSRIDEARARLPAGNLRARVPANVVLPLGRMLARPYSPDRLLVRRVLRHEAVESLFKETLVGAIGAFARKLRTPGLGSVGGMNPMKGLGRLKDSFGEGMRESLLGGLSQELERQAELRIREFVDGAIQTIMDEVAVHLCDPTHAARQGAYRAYLLDTLLDTDLRTLSRELDKLDPEAMVQTARAVLNALVGRPELRDELRGGLEALAREAGQKTVGEALREAGLDEASWRPSAEALLAREARSFGQSPAFRGWLGEILGA